MEIAHLDHAFVTDNDVLMLTNVTQEVSQCYRGCRTVGIRCFSVLMDSQSVSSFVDFITHVYQERKYEELIKQHPIVSDMILHMLWMLEWMGAHPEV
jgi:hypothetical protein